jgi:hypothetical protein
MIVKRTLLTKLSIDVFVIVIVVLAILFIDRVLLLTSTTTETTMALGRAVTKATTVEVE